MNLPKRLVLALGVPLATASIVGGSVAFAASQQTDPTPTAPSTPTAPAAPTTPGQNGAPRNGTHDPANCPNMGGSGGSGTTTGGSTPQTSFHMRGHSSAQARYY